MKIGIITFHWANNFGAILQTWALQDYLHSVGLEVEIIDYKPWLSYYLDILRAFLRNDQKYFRKLNELKTFRKIKLNLSKKTFYSNRALKKVNNYDGIICGSDQIWNNSFALKGEGKITLSYFLDFIQDNTTYRCAYAASIGSDSFSHSIEDAIVECLKKFDMVSVREFSALKLMENYSILAKHVLDPTMLRAKDNYNDLSKTGKYEHANKPYIFKYVLHNKEKEMEQIEDYLSDKLKIKELMNSSEEVFSIEDWLSAIKNSSFVITNSYHGLIFSLIYEKPFIVLPVKDTNMNNRIITILEITELSSRLIQNQDDIDDKIIENLNWDDINRKLSLKKFESKNYLNDMIKGINKNGNN